MVPPCLQHRQLTACVCPSIDAFGSTVVGSLAASRTTSGASQSFTVVSQDALANSAVSWDATGQACTLSTASVWPLQTAVQTGALAPGANCQVRSVQSFDAEASQ